MAQDTVRYICPVCDQEVAAGSHFCWNCKRIVRNPWRYTGGHLPNENHDGCHPMPSFMRPRERGAVGTASPSTRSHTPRQKSAAGRSAARGSGYGQNTGQRSIYQRNASQKSTYQNAPTQGTGGARRNKNSGAGALIAVLIIFWFIIQMIISLAS